NLRPPGRPAPLPVNGSLGDEFLGVALVPDQCFEKLLRFRLGKVRDRLGVVKLVEVGRGVLVRAVQPVKVTLIVFIAYAVPLKPAADHEALLGRNGINAGVRAKGLVDDKGNVAGRFRLFLNAADELEPLLSCLLRTWDGLPTVMCASHPIIL